MSEQPRHVFVDASGRRAAWLRRTGWTVTVLVSAYLLVLVVALVSPAGLSRLAVPGLRGVLPEVGAAQLEDGEGGSGDPQDVLEGTGTDPTPRPTVTDPAVSSGGGPRATPGPVSATTAPGQPSATAGPGNRPSTPPGQVTSEPTTEPSPTAAAGPNGQGSGKPSSPPARRPTAKPTRSPRA